MLQGAETLDSGVHGENTLDRGENINAQSEFQEDIASDNRHEAVVVEPPKFRRANPDGGFISVCSVFAKLMIAVASCHDPSCHDLPLVQ